VFPPWARKWCQQQAHELQVSVDLPALTLLGLVAGCVGGAVRAWRNSQWMETVRRFVCRVRWCRRKLFAERLPDLVEPFARRTTRLNAHLL
jgi:hypothetical protein